MIKKLLVTAALLLIIPQVAHAVITFDQLGDDVFTVSHAVKLIGGRGVAMDVVYEKMSSLCIAAGYTHMKVLSQESNAGSDYESPNATIRAQFYFSASGEGVVKCEVKASDRYIEQAKKKLDRRGYKAPVAAAAATEPVEGGATCSIQQIMTMTKAGLTDEQIKAACPGNDLSD